MTAPLCVAGAERQGGLRTPADTPRLLPPEGHRTAAAEGRLRVPACVYAEVQHGPPVRRWTSAARAPSWHTAAASHVWCEQAEHGPP